MSEPFLGEIVMFGGNFAPRSWSFCSGQLLPISQNTAVFSILGTTYGGDGRTTFALPDMRGRFPTHSGGSTGPGLTPRALGSWGGTETVTLQASEMPQHTHTAALNAETRAGNLDDPTNNMLASRSASYRAQAAAADVQLHPASITVANAGGNQAHNNMPPFLTVNFIIALQGIFPSRN
ncbi:phage tail protein [Tropicibacter sp. S64]|uniref:phage tail protein n=1 Tax=Tropicibacter sp. S64 TaxID=3415122 RepID=UPI003C7AFD32